MRARRVRTTHFALLHPEGIVQHSPAQGRRFGAPLVFAASPRRGRTAQPRVAASAHPWSLLLDPEGVVQHSPGSPLRRTLGFMVPRGSTLKGLYNSAVQPFQG